MVEWHAAIQYARDYLQGETIVTGVVVGCVGDIAKRKQCIAGWLGDCGRKHCAIEVAGEQLIAYVVQPNGQIVQHRHIQRHAFRHGDEHAVGDHIADAVLRKCRGELFNPRSVQGHAHAHAGDIIIHPTTAGALAGNRAARARGGDADGVAKGSRRGGQAGIGHEGIVGQARAVAGGQ